MQKQSIEHHTKKQFKVKNTNIKNLQKERVILSKRLDKPSSRKSAITLDTAAARRSNEFNLKEA